MKKKVSVTLDADPVAEIESGGGNLSAKVNAVLREDLERVRQQRALARLLDRLADERGPLDTEEDEAEIARYMALLGGPDAPPADDVPAP